VNVKDMEKNYIKGIKTYRLLEIDQQKYYEGFKVRKEKRMFQEELKDLESVYRTTLESVEEKLIDIRPFFLYYMEQYLELNRQKRTISEKLEELLEKLGRKPEGENGQDE
jgi:hypothetical protein